MNVVHIRCYTSRCWQQEHRALSCACSAPNLKAMDNISAQHPAQSACDARRVQRRARREQRKALVLALVQRLLDLDSAEQGKSAQLRPCCLCDTARLM